MVSVTVSDTVTDTVLIGGWHDAGERLCQVVYVVALQYERRQDSQYVGIAAGAGQDIVFEQGVANLRGRSIADEAEQQPHTLDLAYRPDDALLANLCLASAYVGQQVLVNYAVDRRRDGGCRNRSAAWINGTRQRPWVS